MSTFQVLSYGQIRLAWCRAALLRLLRRWGIYLTVGVLVLGGAGSSALAAMSALAAASVLPLLHAAQQGPLTALPITLAYALAGGGLVWGLAPLLWPRAWAEVERALPIAPGDQRLSDLAAVLLGLTPLFAVYLAGAAIWWAKSPPWLLAVWARALGLLISAMALSVALGVAILWRRRSLSVSATSQRSAGESARGSALTTGPRLWVATLALVWLPLRRGRAHRSARFLGASLLILWACASFLARWPLHAPWWLAAFALLAQAFSTRLSSLVNRELEPLHDACAALPLSALWLSRSRQIVALAPLLSGLPALGLALAWSSLVVQPEVLCAYAAVMLGGNLALNATAARNSASPLKEDAAARVSWWLVVVVMQIALASEVVAR